MSMTSMTTAELIELAQERAAMEVETWIPETVGDKIAGIVRELGTISTKFGEYYTTTIEVIGGSFIEVGKTKTAEPGTFIRVAWMGAVLKATFMRLIPAPLDIVAFHYQKDLSPANGKNDYALIVAAVIDPKTQQSKMPVNLNVFVPSAAQIMGADPRTGELATVDPSVVDRFSLRQDEEAFPSSDPPADEEKATKATPKVS